MREFTYRSARATTVSVAIGITRIALHLDDPTGFLRALDEPRAAEPMRTAWMDVRDAAELVAPAVRSGQTWADLGAGTGTFTAALARLVGPAGAVYAIERDASRVRALEQLARQIAHDARIPITVRRGDFTQPMDLPSLDGALLANALHYIPAPAQAETLQRLAARIGKQGALVVVEYDNRPASQWVPYPISRPRLAVLARQAGLSEPELIGQRRSAFGGTMYSARLRIA